MKSEKKPRFILSRRNQKGQVAVFVALIFQVVFVFFAMLINVGLLVHHKINLQQSTDLAAYYGAMKQAEILNVMAHVNYQIRQAWKLFTWRYRVLGTFGVSGVSNSSGQNTPGIKMPITWGQFNSVFKFDENANPFKCPASFQNAKDINLTDVPFMCMGHIGFKDWPAPDVGDETFCKVDCGHMNQAATVIKGLSDVGSFKYKDANISVAVNTAIGTTNEQIKDRCESMGPTSLAMLGLFYSNYYFDTSNRKKVIQILEKNLGLGETEILDLEGKKIFSGVENTLKNNLTEANLSSLNANSVTTFNGAKGQSDKILREITFDYLNFFLLQCSYENKNASIAVKNLSDDEKSGAFHPNQPIWNKFKIKNPGFAEEIKNLFAQNSKSINTLGFEKNPWYNVYYGVKATSEPRIPFLPLSKIKLHAISFAKPFGGTIGPWYYKSWSPGSIDNSTASDFEQGRTDLNLPARNLQEAGFGIGELNSLKDSIRVTPNFSLYVGDTLGLRDHKYLGIYQGILNAKKIPNNLNQNTKISYTKSEEVPDRIGKRIKPTAWPQMSDWNHLTKDVTELNDYDPLAVHMENGNAVNTFTRDIEISVVAPNQFDVANYSIEPNFYQAYGKGKLLNQAGTSMEGLKKMADAVGENSSEIAFPHDFGSTVNDKIAGLAREFNVSRQLQVVTELFATGKVNDIPVDNISAAESMFFTFIPRNPAALLSGWTYNDPRNYKKFPEPDDTIFPYNMHFGSCNDTDRKGSGNEKIYSTLKEDNNSQPDVPGNCVTGGRTGYSVKLISSDMVRVKTKHKDLGGPGTGSAPITNPVDENFLKF